MRGGAQVFLGVLCLWRKKDRGGCGRAEANWMGWVYVAPSPLCVCLWEKLGVAVFGFSLCVGSVGEWKEIVFRYLVHCGRSLMWGGWLCSGGFFGICDSSG